MGIEGAGWATSVSLWLKAGTLALLVLRKSNRRAFDTARGMAFDITLFRRLLHFGGPSGLQMLLDVGGFRFSCFSCRDSGAWRPRRPPWRSA